MADKLEELRKKIAEALQVNVSSAAGSDLEQLPPQDQLDLITQLLRLITVHDRDINMLVDRCTFNIAIFNEKLKQEIAEIRKKWREEDPNRKLKKTDNKPKSSPTAETTGIVEMEDDAPGYVPHPFGSQRGIVFALLMQMLTQRIPPESDAHAAATRLLKINTEECDTNVFRLRPKHDLPREDKPWNFTLVLSAAATTEFVRDLRKLAKTKIPTLDDQLKVFCSQTRDGNIVKTIRAELRRRRGTHTTVPAQQGNEPAQQPSAGSATISRGPAVPPVHQESLKKAGKSNSGKRGRGGRGGRGY